MTKIEYSTYLQSNHWRQLRLKILRQRNFTCEKCGWRHVPDLNVHHKTYERLGRELDSDLELLCKWCHKGEHFGPAMWEDIGRRLRSG